MTRTMNLTISIFSACLLTLMPAAHLPAAASEGEYEKSVDRYDCPSVTLLNQDREEVNLKELVDSDKPVMLEFVFTSCQTICPIMSAGFSNFQKKMGNSAGDVRLVSISIDPQHDTPERMKKYLEKYEAGPTWDFFTGERDDIVSITTAFKAQTPDKMEHLPLTFLRAAGEGDWVRLEGLLSGGALMNEYKELMAK